MAASQKAQERIDAAIATLRTQHGGALAGLKERDAWDEAFADEVDRHDFRMAFTRAAHEDRKQAKSEKPDPPQK